MRVVSFLLCAAIAASAAEPVQLFNGKDLSGWQMVGPGRFEVEDGMLKTVGGMGLLYYKERPFGNQTLRVVFKTATGHANSGVFIRLPERPKDPWYGVHNGYEVQIDAGGDEWHSTGAIYSLSKANKRMQKPAGEWNTMDIELKGTTTRISVNGELVNEFRGDQEVPERKQWYEPIRGPRPEVGFIGLQNHDAKSTVYFKEISIIGGDAAPPKTGNVLTQGERDYAMSYLHSSRKQFLDAVSGLTEAQWNYKAAPERWSIAEIAEHIIVTEEALMKFHHAALMKPSVGGERTMKDQDFVKRMTDRSQKATAPEMLRPTNRWKTKQEMVEAFKTARDQSISYIERTNDDLRGHLRKSYGDQIIDGYQYFLMLPGHSERHVMQMLEVKAAPEYPKN